MKKLIILIFIFVFIFSINVYAVEDYQTDEYWIAKAEQFLLDNTEYDSYAVFKIPNGAYNWCKIFLYNSNDEFYYDTSSLYVTFNNCNYNLYNYSGYIEGSSTGVYSTEKGINFLSATTNIYNENGDIFFYIPTPFLPAETATSLVPTVAQSSVPILAVSVVIMAILLGVTLTLRLLSRL